MKTITPYNSVILYEKTRIQPIDIDGAATTMLIVSAIEAFINDVVAYYETISSAECGMGDNFRKGVVRTTDGDWLVMTDSEHNLLDTLAKIQFGSTRLEQKLIDVSLALGSGHIKKGCNPYQGFQALLSIRNQLVHAKSVPLVVDEDKKIDMSSYPKVVKNLIQNKTITNNNGVQNSWIYALDSKEYTMWCRSIFLEISVGLLDFLPSSSVSQFFKSEYKNSFGWVDVQP
ncbi:hypothetical protein CF117_19335 [Aeromonas veronii]|uniref:hypothetical protein n=1 Tax=Aeromonas veronii TaxID=654 RepID=UPI001119E8A7|nr:hypothetical protein [Aeromonas veronii]TNI98987.1 hypothetical protein CF117_19335 [Aeromonas veronii]